MRREWARRDEQRGKRESDNTPRPATRNTTSPPHTHANTHAHTLTTRTERRTIVSAHSHSHPHACANKKRVVTRAAVVPAASSAYDHCPRLDAAAALGKKSVRRCSARGLRRRILISSCCRCPCKVILPAIAISAAISPCSRVWRRRCWCRRGWCGITRLSLGRWARRHSHTALRLRGVRRLSCHRRQGLSNR